jgi:CRP/FNR family transcriptional regulator, nitrogen fixation regulation protein
MLMEPVLRRGSSRHPLDRATPRALPAGIHALAGAASIELMGAPMSLRRNARIYEENDRTDHLYKIVSGTVRTCKVLVDGRRQVAAFYLPGEMFGVEAGERHLFSAEAVSDAEVLVIKRGNVILLAQWDHEVSSQVWTLMSRELRRTQDHLLLLAKNALERVATFLLEMAERSGSDDEVELPMPRQDVADYLGLTIETVSRTLTQLESQSAIALPTSKHIVLRNRAALKRLNV